MVENKTEVQKKMEQLQAPFTTTLPGGEVVPDHKWRVQSTKGGKAVCVPYVIVHQVETRLDEVFGANNWSLKMDPQNDRTITSISVRFDPETNDWVDKTDVGTPSEYAKIKGEASDSIKRAAVQLGVGRYLRDIGSITLKSKGKHPLTDKNIVLDAPEALTSYINTMNPYRLKLAEIYRAIPKEKQADFDDCFKKVLSILK